ncbi:MAG: FAD-dependent oxidoreductase [Alkalibacterium sp.]|nr:FAD-dependent oxidoreductase [Alkalibacterium sp.]
MVIGSGVAGKSAAMKLASAGKKVAIIEADLWGGTCPNRGCDPKKVLVSAVEAQNKARQMIGRGIHRAPAINWPEPIAFKNTFTDPVPKQSRESLESSGVETYSGAAEFVDRRTLKVGEARLEADKIIIATGAHPNLLPVKGQEHFLTSDNFLSRRKCPKQSRFIGAGYIAFEFAAVAAAAGAEVHAHPA